MNTTEPEEIIEETGIIRLPYRFYIPNAKEELESVCYDGAYEKYGKPLPKQIESRLQEELHQIGKYCLEHMYLLPIKLAEKCKELNSILLTRGCAGNSLLLYLGGVTPVNPLPPHYYCPVCKFTEFVIDADCKSGFDLLHPDTDAKCPKCGAKLTSDGNHLDYEFLLGSDGSKLPIIEFDIDFKDQQELVDYLKTFLTSEEELAKTNIGTELILISSDIIPLLKKLETATGIPAENIDPTQIDIASFFVNGDFEGIPLEKDYYQKMLPKYFSDMVTLSGFKQGTWVTDIKELLNEGTSYRDMIAFRDDVMTDLRRLGLSKPEAFRFAEIVRKGKAVKFSEELLQLTSSHGVPQSYIESMKNVLHLFPKAHTTEWILTVCKLIWYKTFYPAEFKSIISEEV